MSAPLKSKGVRPPKSRTNPGPSPCVAALGRVLWEVKAPLSLCTGGTTSLLLSLLVAPLGGFQLAWAVAESTQSSFS